MSQVVRDRSWGRPEGYLFNSYYIEVQGRALLLSLDCSTLTLIRTLYCWVLSKEVSSTIFKVFGMTWPMIEPRSPGPLANTHVRKNVKRFILSICVLSQICRYYNHTVTTHTHIYIYIYTRFSYDDSIFYSRKFKWWNRHE